MNTPKLILEQALWLFNMEGYDAVSFRAVAAKAGISIGNVQYHYPTKTDILKKLMSDRVFVWNWKPDARLRSDNSKFKDWAEQFLEHCFHHRFFFEYPARICEAHPDIRDQYLEFRRKRLQEMAQYVSPNAGLRSSVPELAWVFLMGWIQDGRINPDIDFDTWLFTGVQQLSRLVEKQLGE